MAAPLLQLDQVTIRFGGLTAVGAVDLTINEGELLGLIGPNGAGKTTIFNLITGVYQPTGGRIAFHGSIENQRILPFGTVDEVIAEVTESVEIYQGSRWICAPCHRLQPVTPTANIVALYETIHALG